MGGEKAHACRRAGKDRILRQSGAHVARLEESPGKRREIFSGGRQYFRKML